LETRKIRIFAMLVMVIMTTVIPLQMFLANQVSSKYVYSNDEIGYIVYSYIPVNSGFKLTHF